MHPPDTYLKFHHLKWQSNTSVTVALMLCLIMNEHWKIRCRLLRRMLFILQALKVSHWPLACLNSLCGYCLRQYDRGFWVLRIFQDNLWPSQQITTEVITENICQKRSLLLLFLSTERAHEGIYTCWTVLLLSRGYNCGFVFKNVVQGSTTNIFMPKQPKTTLKITLSDELKLLKICQRFAISCITLRCVQVLNHHISDVKQ